mgnify:CR=1 FL=1
MAHTKQKGSFSLISATNLLEWVSGFANSGQQPVTLLHSLGNQATELISQQPVAQSVIVPQLGG